ncbi:hypothetical protein Tco_1143371 [Tanacetum coccineum]
MDDESMWVADRVVAPTPGFAIIIPEIANEFAIKGNHLTLIKGNQFDGRIKTDPHKHIHELLEICDMFKYRDTENEVVHLMMFPLSLTREAKTWLDETKELSKRGMNFELLSLADSFPHLFSIDSSEKFEPFLNMKRSLINAFLRMKEMLRNCHGHNLSKSNIIKIFYYGLNETTQEVLNAAAGDKFERFNDKQYGRTSGSLPSNTQPNPKGSSSKPYQPPQARNEHVNVVFTRSGKTYDPPINLNDQPNDSETPINFDCDDEDDEPTP